MINIKCPFCSRIYNIGINGESCKCGNRYQPTKSSIHPKTMGYYTGNFKVNYSDNDITIKTFAYNTFLLR